jgi:hypothetical protein
MCNVCTHQEARGNICIQKNSAQVKSTHPHESIERESKNVSLMNQKGGAHACPIDKIGKCVRWTYYI